MLMFASANWSPLCALEPPAAKTFECTTRIEITHLEIVPSAKPVPIEVAASAHAGHVVSSPIMAHVLPVQQDASIGRQALAPPPSFAELRSMQQQRMQQMDADTERWKNMSARFNVVARPSEKAAAVTEIELRYRSNDRRECVTTTNAIAGAYQEYLDRLESNNDTEIEKLKAALVELDKYVEYYRVKDNPEKEAECRDAIRDYKKRVELLQLKNRVGKFVVTVRLPAVEAVELKSR
jgi:hypothetical protein